MGKLRIMFKTKGGHKEGMGDVTSSLALAEGFRSHGNEVAFIINSNKNVVDLVLQKGFGINTAESMAELANCLNEKQFDIAILNQMNTPEDEALLFKNHSKMLVTVEDTGIGAQLADLRFNILYPIDNSISDFRFIPLSPVFQDKHRISKEIKGKVENILVTQGGSDTYGFTPKIIKALSLILTDISVNVILGSNFSHDIELENVLSKSPRKINIIKGKNDLSDLMLETDLAISAGGNTLFELACLGVPTIVVCGETFEVETADRLQKEGFGINLGFGKYVDEKDVYNIVNQLVSDANLRIKMSIKGKELIDGSGIKRMVDAMTETYYRKCKEGDCNLSIENGR